MQRKKKTATRRGNNEGSIYQRKDGLWIAQVSVGLKADGKPARKSFTGKSRAEVAEKIIPYLNKNKGQVVLAKEDVTIDKHLMFWLMNYKITTVSPRTFESCIRNMRNHIIPVFGYLKPQNLTIDHLQPHFRTLLENYELDTVKKIKYVFSQYLDYHARQGMGICSLSELKNSKEMWNNYADGEKGYCIEYDLQGYENVNLLLPVVYQDNREKNIVMNMVAAFIGQMVVGMGYGQIAADRSQYMRMFLTKDTKWVYQKEWRLLGDANYKLSAPSIHAIYLGKNMDDQNKKQMIDYCQTHEIVLHF